MSYYTFEQSKGIQLNDYVREIRSIEYLYFPALYKPDGSIIPGLTYYDDDNVFHCGFPTCPKPIYNAFFLNDIGVPYWRQFVLIRPFYPESISNINNMEQKRKECAIRFLEYNIFRNFLQRENDYCCIYHLPENIYLMQALYVLIMIHQPISYLPSTIHSLQNLRYLYIRQTNIKEFPRDSPQDERHILHRLNVFVCDSIFLLTPYENEIIIKRINSKENTLLFFQFGMNLYKNPTDCTERTDISVITAENTPNSSRSPSPAPPSSARGGKRSRKKRTKIRK